MMRWFDKLVDVIEGWTERGSRRSGEGASTEWLLRHEKDLTRIDETCAILRDQSVPAAEVAAERAQLRERRGLGGKRKLRDILVLVAMGGIFLYGAVASIETAVAEGQIGKLLFRAALIVVVTIVAVAAWAAVARGAERSLQGVRDRLGAEGGLAREKAVLEWLERNWQWPSPPAMFEGTTADLQGMRGSRPFLVVSQVEHGDEPQLRTAINRTCVFIAGDGGQARRLATITLAPLALPVHVAVTPAGLFAYWATGTLWGRRPPEDWEAMLDQLIRLADLEGVKARPTASATNERSRK